MQHHGATREPWIESARLGTRDRGGEAQVVRARREGAARARLQAGQSAVPFEVLEDRDRTHGVVLHVVEQVHLLARAIVAEVEREVVAGRQRRIPRTGQDVPQHDTTDEMDADTHVSEVEVRHEAAADDEAVETGVVLTQE